MTVKNTACLIFVNSVLQLDFIMSHLFFVTQVNNKNY